MVPWCTSCSACTRKEPGASKISPLLRAAGFPMERMEMNMLDLLTIYKANDCNTYVLVIIDRFRISGRKLFPCLHMQWKQSFLPFWHPSWIKDVNLKVNYSNKFEFLNIEKTRSSVDHAHSYGEFERFNRVLGKMLRCYVSDTQD